MNAAARNRFVLPRTQGEPTRGRLILPEPRKREPAPEAPRPAMAPAYVPYSSPMPAPSQPYGRRAGFAPADTGMATMSIIGLALTIVMGIPVGIVTGPMALKRAARIEQLMRTGRRPRSDESSVTSVRVTAWLSIAWSIPLIGIYLLVLVMFLAVLG
ncbi:MAG: hypothetical protein KDB82_03040 [Planctomycetes bacterium]|nr:hypothetical protein [Planctomycetota bacterium]